jgi:hypothetical protein
VAEQKEKTVKETYRLPAGDAQYIRWLADHNILGSNRSAVARALLGNAIQELVKSEYVKKYLDSVQLLTKR